MPDFYLMDKTRQQVLRKLLFKGDVKKLSVDCSSWADDNGTVTSATWAVKSGQVSISSETLVDNVAACILTSSESGNSMLTLSVADGTHTEVQYIRVKTKDPEVVLNVDYGLAI